MTIKTPSSTPGGPKFQEEKIFVTVRVRPLSRKQPDLKDQISVECTDDHTILFKNTSNRRSNSSSYTFDKVFGPSCLTEKVYEEGAKDVALSALFGINATIFAYGQTASGKTFTMRGIIERVINDIYNHIQNTPNRIFVIKLSALEIYNETVMDMLNPETGQLRLLDDPEKGTIVEKLDERLAEDDQHLRHLISICEARRQVGETSLNDTSSRSHQIIRLVVESSLRESTGCVKSFLATLNLVDLAGSERAHQLAIGTRLKEGRHINLSLLTLSTVIRKLSGGQRNCHIPYRDSKLTRILQSSLGGNARTAIICTLSPALSHVEQSHKTLKFAINAKEVTNVAQVNMVVSDKQLVKNLQKEVARLEAELRTPDPSSSSWSETLLREKELKIQQMEMELKALKLERDIARFELDELRKEVQSHEKQGSSHRVAKCLTYAGNVDRKRGTVGRKRMLRQLANAPVTLMHEIRKLEQIEIQLGLEAKKITLLLHDVEINENQDAAKTLEKLLAEIKEMRAASTTVEEAKVKDDEDIKHNSGANLKEEIIHLNSQGNSIGALEMQLQNAQKSIDRLMMSLPNIQETPLPRKCIRPERLPLVLRNSINSEQTTRSPCTSISSAHSVQLENVAPESDELVAPGDLVEHCTAARKKREYDEVIPPTDCTPGYQCSSSVDVRKMEKIFKNAVEENVKSIKAYVTELKERVAKLQYQKRLLVCQVVELEESNEVSASHTEMPYESPPPWDQVFEGQRKQIILLWHLCHVSIIRRSQFYLLFRGDPADQIYMEVELQRLTWLEEHLADLGNASPALLGDEPAFSISSSIKALKHEREFLAKKVNSRLSAEERQVLYAKWDIPVSWKHRRLQLVNKLWMDPYDMENVQESAVIVAKLAGFYESGGLVAKEMLELNFVSPQGRRPWHLDWSPISNLLRL